MIMKTNKTAFCALLLISALLLPDIASASPKEARRTLIACLKGKVNTDETLVCIGSYSDSCAEKFENMAPIPQISGQSQCLLDEAEAWNTLRDDAVESWKEDNGTSFSANIAKIAKASAPFAKIKCSVFQDTAQFGQTGMALEAECLRDEAARTSIFIGYALD